MKRSRAKNKDDFRIKLIKFRVSVKDHERILKLAAINGVTVSDLLRSYVLKGDKVKKDER